MRAKQRGTVSGNKIQYTIKLSPDVAQRLNNLADEMEFFFTSSAFEYVLKSYFQMLDRILPGESEVWNAFRAGFTFAKNNSNPSDEEIDEAIAKYEMSL